MRSDLNLICLSQKNLIGYERVASAMETKQMFFESSGHEKKKKLSILKWKKT